MTARRATPFSPYRPRRSRRPVEEMPPLPASARWEIEERPHLRLSLMIAAALVLHVGVFLLLKDLPLYEVDLSGERVSAPTGTFQAVSIAPVIQDGRVVQPAEQQFTVSTRLLPPPQDSSGEVAAAPPAGVSGWSDAAVPLPSTASAGRLEPSLLAAPSRLRQVSLFNVRASNSSVVYVLDVSGSMQRHLRENDVRTRLETARREIIRSLFDLPDTVLFNVILFADRSHQFAPALVPGLPSNKERAALFLQELPQQKGATDLVAGLESALLQQAETVFLLTDGATHLPDWKVMERLRQSLPTRGPAPQLYAFAMTQTARDDGAQLLRNLVKERGGSFIPQSQWLRD